MRVTGICYLTLRQLTVGTTKDGKYRILRLAGYTWYGTNTCGLRVTLRIGRDCVVVGGCGFGVLRVTAKMSKEN